MTEYSEPSMSVSITAYRTHLPDGGVLLVAEDRLGRVGRYVFGPNEKEGAIEKVKELVGNVFPGDSA